MLSPKKQTFTIIVYVYNMWTNLYFFILYFFLKTYILFLYYKQHEHKNFHYTIYIHNTISSSFIAKIIFYKKSTKTIIIIYCFHNQLQKKITAAATTPRAAHPIYRNGQQRPCFPCSNRPTSQTTIGSAQSLFY